jgi:hypothetical protein
LDSLAILPIIFDSINKEALDYEASQDCSWEGCCVHISFRNILRVQGNCAGQIMIGHDISNVDVFQAIFDFYDKEKIELDTYSTARFMCFNDSILNSEINHIEKYIKQLRNEKNSHLESYIAFKNEELKAYQRYRLYKKVLRLDELLIPYIYSHVQINAHNNCDILDNLLKKAFEAFYIMRDKESKKYFGQSYVYLFNKARLKSDLTSLQKLEIINYLIPIQLKRKEKKGIPPPPDI